MMTQYPHVRQRSPRGFTLVELLVSVGLTVILMWGIFQLYTGATRFSATMFVEADMVAAGRAALDRLCHDLMSAATLDTGYLQITTDNDTRRDTLQFVAPVGRDSALVHVKYDIQSVDGTTHVGKLCRSIISTDTANGGTASTTIPAVTDAAYGTASDLGARVETLRLQWINVSSTSGTPEAPVTTGTTTTTWTDGDRTDADVPPLPRAVLIEIKLMDTKRNIAVTLSTGAHLGGSGL